MARPKKKLGLAQPLSKAGKQSSIAKGTVEASPVSAVRSRDQTQERPAKRVKWSGTKGDSKTTAKLVKGLQNAKPQFTEPEVKKSAAEKIEEPLKPAIKHSDKPNVKSKGLDKRPTNPPARAPHPPKIIGQPAPDSILSKLTLPLYESHDILTLSIISSSPIQKKVARVLSHLSLSLSKPALVILTAKAGIASKAISIAEIARRQLGKMEGGVWFQYSALEGVLFEMPAKLSKREKKAQRAKLVEKSAKATEPLVPSSGEAAGTIAEIAKGTEEDGQAAESMTSTQQFTWSPSEIMKANNGEMTQLFAPSGEGVTTENTAGKTTGTKDTDQDKDDDDSAFETMENPVSKNIANYDSFASALDEKKIRAVPVLTLFISRTRVEALKKEYGEQTNATK